MCAQPELSAKDRQLASLYSRLRSNLDGQRLRALIAAQKEWLHSRDSCGNPNINACIARLYDQRIGQLEKVLSYR